jgi:xanthine dehydrogenase YagR molybdenum-binding subunit
MNAHLAGYHIPVNADVPSVEALLVHEDDPGFLTAPGPRRRF